MSENGAKKKVTVWRKDTPQPETFEGTLDSGVDDAGMFYIEQPGVTTFYPLENMAKAKTEG